MPERMAERATWSGISEAGCAEGVARSGRKRGVPFVLVKAHWFDPIVPVSQRAAAPESSPLVGEIIRLSGHERASDLPLLFLQCLESSPLVGEIVRLSGHERALRPPPSFSPMPRILAACRRDRWACWPRTGGAPNRPRLLANEPENSRPTSGEDLGGRAGLVSWPTNLRTLARQVGRIFPSVTERK
jgi:hypothetical protein